MESPFSKYINHVSRSAPTSDIKHVPAYAPSLGVISSAEKGLLEPHSGLASNPYLPRSATATPALDRKEAKDDVGHEQDSKKDNAEMQVRDRLSPARLRLDEDSNESADQISSKVQVKEPAIVRHARTVVDHGYGNVRVYDGKSPTMSMLLKPRKNRSRAISSIVGT